MTYIPGSTKTFYTQDVEAKEPGSEYLLQKLGAAENHFKDRVEELQAEDDSQSSRCSAWSSRGINFQIGYLTGAQIGGVDYSDGHIAHGFMEFGGGFIGITAFRCSEQEPLLSKLSGDWSAPLSFDDVPALFLFCGTSGGDLLTDLYRGQTV
jgi:hypothetical protein